MFGNKRIMVSNYLCPVIVVLSTLYTSDAQECYSGEACLYDYLYSFYNNKVRPALDPESNVTIYVTLSIRALSGIDEKNEVLSIIGSLSAQWDDEFLDWEPADYNNTYLIALFAEDIWIPDLAVVNSAESYFKSTYKEDFRVIASYEGIVTWEFGGVFKTSCSLNLKEYPFDTQVCSIDVENWVYDMSLVDLQFGELIVDYIELEEHTLWKVTGYDYKRSTQEYLNDKFKPKLQFIIKLKRKVLYYLVNIIVPTIFISAITLGLFWLPVGCGEKLGLGITVLLAFSVFQIIIMNNTPVNSDVTPRISQVVVFVMAMATISILISIFTVMLDFSSSKTRVPRFLRTIAFKGLAKIFFLASEIPNIPDENDVSPISITAEGSEDVKAKLEDVSGNELANILKELTKITNYLDSKEMSNSIISEWKLFGKIIDRLMFWLCLAVFLIYFIGTVAMIASN